MSDMIIRLGKYKVSTTRSGKDKDVIKGFKTSIPAEIASVWGFNKDASSSKDLQVYLYAEKRDDGSKVLIISPTPFANDFLES